MTGSSATARLTPPINLTRALAGAVAGIRMEALPSEVVRRTGEVIADALACGVAGSVLAPEIVEPIAALVEDVAGGPCPTLLHQQSVPAMTGAFVNGCTIHTIDYDDTHMAVVSHFGASVVSAALAATVDAGGGGTRLIEAVVAGFEVGARVGRACMPQHYQRWHATSTLGGLAASGAAARAYGLDARATEMAIGLAADDTGGTRVCITQGDISKSLHAGLAAEKGVRAARLVRAGGAGPIGFLEHRFGFFWAYSEERDARRLPDALTDLGARWEILENDIKAHPCILSSHTAIEGAIDLAGANGLTLEDIASVELFQPPYSPGHGMNYEPETAMAARLSVPYCVAVAIRDGHVGLAQFEGERWLDPTLRRHLRKVTLQADEGLAARFAGQAPTRIRVTTRSGEVQETEIGIARGSHRRPLRAEELRAKHDELLARRLTLQERERWHGWFTDLPAAPDLSVLDALVRGQR